MEPRREPTREDMSLTEPVLLSDDVVRVRSDSEPGALKELVKIRLSKIQCKEAQSNDYDGLICEYDFSARILNNFHKLPLK